MRPDHREARRAAGGENRRLVLRVADLAAIVLHGRATSVGSPEEIAPELEAAYLGELIRLGRTGRR